MWWVNEKADMARWHGHELHSMQTVKLFGCCGLVQLDWESEYSQVQMVCVSTTVWNWEQEPVSCFSDQLCHCNISLSGEIIIVHLASPHATQTVGEGNEAKVLLVFFVAIALWIGEFMWASVSCHSHHARIGIRIQVRIRVCLFHLPYMVALPRPSS